MAATPTKKELANVNLRFVDSDSPGLSRRRSGRGFSYLDTRGERVVSTAVLNRIRKLAIPPAWTEVWISPDPRAYLQATGRDEKGRKQSIYHADWVQYRECKKYSRLGRVSRAIARARKGVQRHLKRSGLSRTKVFASVVRLLDLSLIRVGNDRYAAENGSYGLTTLRNRHVEIAGTRITFKFKGKSGKDHEVKLIDRSLALLLGKLKALKGARLFQYLDESGKARPVKAEDVNRYLQEVGGPDLTAKDFRTLGATQLASRLVRKRKPSTKREVNEIVSEVADTLGNTPAICRKSYIDPSVWERTG